MSDGEKRVLGSNPGFLPALRMAHDAKLGRIISGTEPRPQRSGGGSTFHGGVGNTKPIPKGSTQLREDVAEWIADDPGSAPVKFCAKYITHVTGPMAGQPFVMEPWQVTATETFFGTLDPDGERTFTEAYVEVPRKNGKTTWVAALLVWLLVGDPVAGGELYVCAADRKQARICFGISRRMCEASPDLMAEVQLYQYEIRHPESGSVLTALSSDAGTKHGLNPSVCIFDELHAQKNRDLWEAMDTAQGARANPVLWSITTAGVWDPESLGYEMHERSLAVLSGAKKEPWFMPVLYGLDMEDDWEDESNWAKANPNLGVSVGLKYLRKKYSQAKDRPANENSFRRLYLNQWSQQSTRWLAMDTWARGDARVILEDGDVCFGGLDLASTTDLTALVLAFPKSDGIHILPHFYIPESKFRDSSRDRVDYEGWARRGLLTATPGDQTDYSFIRADLGRLAEKYDIQEIAFDAWGSVHLRTQLEEEDGFTMVKFGQSLQQMSGPTKDMERLLLDGKIRHGNHEVLTWNASNLAVYIDGNENIKPMKNKSHGRIDGIVALIMALARVTANDYDSRSIYDTRGLRSL